MGSPGQLSENSENCEFFTEREPSPFPHVKLPREFSSREGFAKMVETKTAKRKMAAKTASRAANEISNASIKAAKDAKEASKKAAAAAAASSPAPAASRTTRSAAGGGAKGAGAGGAAGKGPAAGGKGKKASAAADPDPAEREPFEAGSDGDDGSSDGDEDEGGEQRLVIKLEKKQEKKLAAGLKKIQGPAAAPGESAVVYLGRVPFGFFEKEMRSYFEQFGEVKRLRLSRNKKTGKSKHYAFIEFEHHEVAAIVAETHDNMLICDRMVKCNLVPTDKIHETMFKGADEEFKAFPWKKMAKAESGRKRTVQEEEKRVKGLVSREKKKRSKIEALGIEYDYDGFERLAEQSKPKKTKFDE